MGQNNSGIKHGRLMFIVANCPSSRIKDIEDCLSFKFEEYQDFYVYNSFETGNMFNKHMDFNRLRLWINGVAIPRTGSISEIQKILDAGFGNGSNSLHEILPSLFSNGAYAVASVENKSLRVFNDFFGTYPVYYYYSPEGTLIVSTSLKCLKKISKLEIDFSSVQEFVLTGMNLSCKTVYQDVRLLPPASVLIFENNKLSTNRYESFSHNKEILGNKPEIIEEIYKTYSDAVKRIYSPEKRYLLSLSGGMDSRMIYVNWPNPSTMLTETAGEGTTDYIIARKLVNRIGNPSTHLLEEPFRKNYTEGFDLYYSTADNPMLLRSQFNMFHLQAKINRGADIHLSGIGGEYINGENLYVSRRPINVIKEMFFDYKYNPITESNKHAMIWNALRLGSKQNNHEYLGIGTYDIKEYLNLIVNLFNDFIGVTKFEEVFIERFRTYLLANSGFRCFSGVFDRVQSFLIIPNSDISLIQTIARYHPTYRELRKLGFEILKKDLRVRDIPVDTTHLPVNIPYSMHKFMRPIRMVVNKGFKKKIPLIQKGKSQEKGVFPYFMEEYGDLREHIKETILKCNLLNREKVLTDIQECENISQYNIYTAAKLDNLLILYRLSRALNGN